MARTLIACKNPVWADAAHTCITSEATFNEIGSSMPFNVMASDPEEHGRELWAALLAGKCGEIAPYVAPQHKTLPSSGKGPHVIG